MRWNIDIWNWKCYERQLESAHWKRERKKIHFYHAFVLLRHHCTDCEFNNNRLSQWWRRSGVRGESIKSFSKRSISDEESHNRKKAIQLKNHAHDTAFIKCLLINVAGGRWWVERRRWRKTMSDIKEPSI